MMAANPVSAASDRIASIASSFLSVPEHTPVHELLASLKEPHEHAIAVVDINKRVKGLILPQSLVDLLGKPFGRDLLLRERVEDIMVSARCFPKDEYIQEVRERLGGSLEIDLSGHWVLVDDSGAFYGHVTSRDILIHAMRLHHHEMETASRIQNRLVPPSIFKEGRGLRFLASSVMAQGVGGDYYYIKEYSSDRWFFSLCDISGKGVSAAIVTAVLAGFLCTADFSKGLIDLVSRLNALILETFTLEKYLTGIFALFDAREGRLEYCDMGHSLFFTLEGERLERIACEADNVPLGLVEQLDVRTRSLVLNPGSLFVCLSDGFVEQVDRSGRAFDLDRVARLLALSRTRESGLLEAKVRLLEEFWSFKEELPQHDDVSILFFSFIAHARKAGA